MVTEEELHAYLRIAGIPPNTIQRIKRYDDTLHLTFNIKILENPPNFNIPGVMYILKIEEKRLKSLPSSIMNFRCLTRLDLSYLKLQKIPNGLTDLFWLKQLMLGSNSLKFPKEILNLKNLELLNILGNNVSEIPEGISQLENLNSVVIGHNPLDKVPEPIVNHSNIESISISQSRLDKIQDLSVMEKLNKFRASSNKIRKLPKGSFLPRFLEVLDLSHNREFTLGNQIGDLSNLIELNILATGIEILPDELCELNNLEVLYLYNNNLKSLPQNIGQLSNLRQLDLSRNNFTSLPESLADLDKLEQFSIRSEQFDLLPEDFFHLPNLKVVCIGDYSLFSYKWDYGRKKSEDVHALGLSKKAKKKISILKENGVEVILTKPQQKKRKII